MERADEVRQVAEPDLVRDVGDLPRVLREQARRAPQPRPDHVLLGRHAEHAGEQPQEVKLAEPGLARGVVELDRLAGVLVDPQRGVHRAPSVARAELRRLERLARQHLEEPLGEPQADLVDADVAAPVERRLAELAEHHQLGQRRQPAARPPGRAAAERIDRRRVELELVARAADEHGACDKLI